MVNWDIIGIRPPLCYFPAVWETILASEGEGETAKALSESEPELSIDAMEKHFNKRIEIVNRLMESKKLDAKIARVAKRHFEAHLEELKALRTQ